MPLSFVEAMILSYLNESLFTKQDEVIVAKNKSRIVAAKKWRLGAIKLPARSNNSAHELVEQPMRNESKIEIQSARLVRGRLLEDFF